MVSPSSEDILQAARSCFSEGPLLRRLMQQYRPYICPFEEVIRFVPDGSAVLDAGCGDGLLLGLLARLGYRIRGTGFDSSAAAIETAQGMARRLAAFATGSTLDFRCIDARSPWPAGPLEGRFDVVSLVDVLHHVPPAAQRDVLRTAAARLHPGGLLLYKDIAGAPFWRGLPNRLHDLVIARELIHYVPAARVEDWAREEGLKLESASSSTRLWYPHELRVFRKPLVP